MMGRAVRVMLPEKLHAHYEACVLNTYVRAACARGTGASESSGYYDTLVQVPSKQLLRRR